MTKQTKQRHDRRAHLNDFHQNPAGAFEYRGALYHLEGTETQRRQLLIRLWMLALLLAVSAVISGCIPAAGMQSAIYLLLPYAASLVAVISLLWALGRLTAGGHSLREYVYKATVLRLPVQAVLVIIGSGATLLGELIYLFTQGSSGHLGSSLLLLGLQAANMILSIVFRSLISQSKWSK